MRLPGTAELGLMVCAGAVGAGCSARAPSPPPVAPPAHAAPAPVPAGESASDPRAGAAAPCTVLPSTDADVATIGLVDPIDVAHAPVPTNDGERLLFRQLYETLVRVDCTGAVRAGLAATWRLDPGGSTWLLTLRPGARFTDGAAVTAHDLVTSWSVGGGDTTLRPEVRHRVASVVAMSDQVVGVTLHGPVEATPRALAAPALAVAARRGNAVWPLGTRGARIATRRVPPGAPARLDMRMTTTLTDTAVTFVEGAGRDPRDLLDAGVDLLVTRDPATLAYAATVPHLVTVPLAWRRTHVFVTAWRTGDEPPLTASGRAALAADAVQGEARGADDAAFGAALTPCRLELPPARRPAGAPTGRIVYRRGDDAAGELAGRLVGLAAAGERLDTLVSGAAGRVDRAAGLPDDAFGAAFAEGRDSGYLLPVDRAALDACADVRALASGAEWLAPTSMVPLVETRLHLVARRGRGGVTTDWDGGLLVAATEGGR